MLATDVLKRNHGAILELFDQYQRAGRGDHRKKKELFDRIKRAVRTHLSLEEEMLYPAMTRKPSPDAGRALDGVLQEHLLIDDLLVSLSELRPQDPDFDLRIAGLRRAVEDHLLLEQKGPYGEIQRALKRKALEKLGARISARIDLLSRVAFPLS
jgi:hemerythrin HHE cation binding domain-containing protein